MKWESAGAYQNKPALINHHLKTTGWSTITDLLVNVGIGVVAYPFFYFQVLFGSLKN